MEPDELLAIIAPEFANIDATGAILVADMQISSKLCGDKRPLLVAYLAAHILTIGGRKMGASGDVASLTEGELSITYANSTADIKTSLSKTSYGQEFDRLSRGCIFTPRTRVSEVLLYGCC